MAASASKDTEFWYSRGLGQIYDTLEAHSDGLSTEEATNRLSKHGPNRLPKAKTVTVWQIFLRQFKNPLIYILTIAAIVSFAIGEETDAGFIAAVLLVNALVGGIQEWRAERSSQALQQLIRTRATVIRDGETRDIDGEEVVPGDVVLLESGYRVPADIRLVSTHDLEIDESALTGESAPVLKDEEWAGDDRAPLGDRRNMAYAGTVVNRGRGRGVVVETGADTVVGRLAEDVTAVEGGQPPLVTRMERFTRIVGLVVLVAAVITALLGIFVQQYDAVEMFLFAVALAVSAIPEGLPVGITVALGVASRRMAKVGVIVRRLVAVEGLGSCTMIASDKTGTLTANELTVKQIQLPDGSTFEVSGEGYAPEGNVLQDGHPPEPDLADELSRLARASVLCNEGHLSRRDNEWAWRGDPTDIALLALGRKLGWSRQAALDAHPLIDEIPFEPEQRYAATFHRTADETRVFVKGAPERVLEMCTDASEGEFSQPALQQQANELAHDGYRVLAVAEGTVETDAELEQPSSEPTDLTFLGFLGLIDPLRSGVAEAIASAQQAGITVTMITGDHPETALAIARNLGLAESANEVTTGAELMDVSQEKLAEILETTRVFARVSPDQKLKIVEAARGLGHYVAVTGDGVNDAPALRQANIGIAMGKMGTDVARDAADLVISDDNFATIVAGIEQGRVAFDNIRKVIFLLISTGAGEVVLVLLSLAVGLPLPLLPVQILWLNLVTNGVQDVALAFEPKEGNVLNRPPRSPDERIFNRIMIERTLVSALVIGVIGFGTFVWLLDQGLPEAAARNHLLLLIVLFEIVNIGNARSETTSLFQLSPLQSPILLTGTTAAFLIHLVAMYFPPAQAVLGTAPVGLEQWLVLGAIALTIAVAIELHKLSWKARYPSRSETERQSPSQTHEKEA
ncbi:cation-translocating P-type ATPase [Halorussus salinisoli]|uniref:cation-translocating P-type ATPase n=1 Tax=Halorussus salinisoli TaxID=2558242 RepID=UPI0010C198AF|nr:HAD-IC family P-type ATPase [Halorussus salinisoli]